MIGVFGGTFDPIHNGHIKTALYVKQALNLSRLHFVLNRTPPHREQPWLGVKQRLLLLECALKSHPDIFIDRRELDRQGLSYMVDTLKSIRAEIPDQGLCLIIGMDAFYGLPAWHQWRSLFDLCHLLVMTRPGFEQADIAAHMNAEDYRFLSAKMVSKYSELVASETGKILLQSVPQLDISSTQIREKLLNGEDVSQWVSEDVHQQLMRKNFYDN